VDPRKHVLGGGAHWRNLANTTELFMCASDATFLSNYFDHLLVFGKVDYRLMFVFGAYTRLPCFRTFAPSGVSIAFRNGLTSLRFA